MRFSVGYQLPDDDGAETFADIVADYRDHIEEVYFPWVGQASGRAKLGVQRGLRDWTAQRRLEQDLLRLREMGVKLDILFNSNCYGACAASEFLENEVGSILSHLEDTVGGIDVVTTTSLTIARTVKKYFSDIETRASVNMRIGTIEAMRYVSGLFDSFYIQRDVQRDAGYVRDVHEWCRAHRKKLCLLANSGCLHCCPGQTFHDNMVAHDAEIDEMKNIPNWTPHVCWNHYEDRDNWAALLQSTWIRPEDLHHYNGVVDLVKIATRMHSHPRLVIHAYTTGRHDGNLLDLFEPCFSPAITPHIIDNQAFPDDWFDRTCTCDRRCDRCDYCPTVLEAVLRKMA